MEKILDVKIDKLDNFGRGIARREGIIFIDDTLPGDVVDIEITKKKKGYSEAKVLNYKKRSSSFEKSRCAYSNTCGGCNIINLNYQKQLRYKQEKVQELIERMVRENIDIKNIIPSPEQYHYRNKITLHGMDNKIGLYKNKSNDLVEVKECLLVDKKINDIITRIKKFLSNNDCVINTLTIKTTTLDEQMITIYGNMNYDEFYEEFSDIKVIIINDQVITADKYIKEKIFDKYFYISNHSFFQVNMSNVVNLYEIIIDFIKDKNYKNCLDLYCGTGTISLLISDYVDRVYGIEVVKDAINDANSNKELNNRDNVEFILGKVEENIDKFSDIDLLIADPPRQGLDKKTKENIKLLHPKDVIYISCNPITLMRDLNELKDLYDIVEISLCDMFPNTYHVECVCFLKLKFNMEDIYADN